MSLSSTNNSTRTSNKHISDNLPSLYQNKLFQRNISGGSSSNIVFKVLKKSNSALNYNYIRNKPTIGLNSYYFQN